jgi:hypothetical protein
MDGLYAHNIRLRNYCANNKQVSTQFMWKADRSSLKREKSAVYLVFLYQKEKKKYGRNGTINLAGHIKASSSYPVQMRKPYYEDDFTIVHFFR